MRVLNMTAGELYRHYRRQYAELLNTYCQIKNKWPTREIPEISRALFRLGMCVDVWAAVAAKIAKNKFYQGDA